MLGGSAWRSNVERVVNHEWPWWYEVNAVRAGVERKAGAADALDVPYRYGGF